MGYKKKKKIEREAEIYSFGGQRYSQYYSHNHYH